MKTTNLAVLAGASILLMAGNAFAITYSFNDNWINWPGFTSEHTVDALGSPATANTQGMKVTLSEGDKFLQKVEIILTSTTYLNFNSLFINTNYTEDTNWDAWDYLVHSGGVGQSYVSYNGTIVTSNGLYDVNDTYRYTSARDNYRWNVREYNPNGIDANDLTSTTIPYSASLVGNTLTYIFYNDGLALDGGFFVAWAPWCANDVIGGGIKMAPVPEPATMLLFGTGLVGLAGIARRRTKR